MPDDTTCPGDGEALRDAALKLLAERRAHAILLGRRALLSRLLAGAAHATADDVQAAVTLPPGVDPVCLGAVPRALANAKIIVRDGYAETARAAGHARPIARWRLIDRTAAVAWLRDNPVTTSPPATPTQGSLFADTPIDRLPD